LEQRGLFDRGDHCPFNPHQGACRRKRVLIEARNNITIVANAVADALGRFDHERIPSVPSPIWSWDRCNVCGDLNARNPMSRKRLVVIDKRDARTHRLSGHPRIGGNPNRIRFKQLGIP
jgi:hypothetical protein